MIEFYKYYCEIIKLRETPIKLLYLIVTRTIKNYKFYKSQNTELIALVKVKISNEIYNIYIKGTIRSQVSAGKIQKPGRNAVQRLNGNRYYM